jgi:hypothetical protein
VQGQNVSFDLELVAQGNENALAFSLSYDPTKLTFVTANAIDSGVAAALNINSNDAAAGRLGVVLALRSGESFAIGSELFVKVSFRTTNSATGTADIAFGDLPVPKGISDSNASELTADYLPASVAIISAPALRISQLGATVILAWPASATGFVLQESADPVVPSNWSAVTATPVVSNNENSVAIPLSATKKFYRLYHP